MQQLINFQYFQEQVKKTSKKNNISQLKKLLKVAYKHKYIYTNPQCFDARKKIDAAKLKLLGQEFLNSPLVVKAEIKERGWSDRMIEEYLIPDVYKPNKFYKCAGNMKLYSLTKVERLEQEDTINNLIEKNLTRRYQIKVNKERKLLWSGIKFVTAIGDYDIAIALLTRKILRNYRDICLNQEVFKILKPFIIKCFIANEIFTNTYVYWADVKGFKFCFLTADPSLFPTVSGSLDIYNLLYEFPMKKSESDLIYSLSDWKDRENILEVTNFLSKNRIYLENPNWELINQFPLSKYPDPPNEDKIFIDDLDRQKKAMWEGFLKEISPIKEYQKTGCPKQFDCKLMGGNGTFCSNYFVCKKT